MEIPSFYTCILGSTSLYMMIPLLSYVLYSTKKNLLLSDLGANVLCCMCVSLGTWVKYDTNCAIYKLDLLLARSCFILLQINTYYLKGLYFLFFFSVTIPSLYLLTEITYKTSYTTTLILYLLCRYVLYINCMIVLDTDKKGPPSVLATPIYFMTNYILYEYFPDVSYITMCFIVSCSITSIAIQHYFLSL